MIYFFVGKRCENAARVDLFGGIILFYFIFKGGQDKAKNREERVGDPHRREGKERSWPGMRYVVR